MIDITTISSTSPIFFMELFMPRDFLILCDSDGKQVKRITLEMLSKAKSLSNGGKTNVVVLGDVDTGILNPELSYKA